MGRPRAPHRLIPIIYALGASASALTVAALLAILETTAVPTVEGTLAAATRTAEHAESTENDLTWIAGPLEMPVIGVVAPNFDEWYATIAVGAFPPALDPVAALSTVTSQSAVALDEGAAPVVDETPGVPPVEPPPSGPVAAGETP